VTTGALLGGSGTFRGRPRPLFTGGLETSPGEPDSMSSARLAECGRFRERRDTAAVPDDVIRFKLY